MAYNFLCYIIGPLLAAGISFIDILEDYSVFQIKIGLKYKILFCLINGIVCFIVLIFLWNSAILKGIDNPLLKGLYFGVAYSALLKSKIVIYDKKDPTYWNPEEVYNKVIKIFRELIDNSTSNYITETKNKIADKHNLQYIYEYAKDVIDDNLWLNKEENIIQKNKYLSGIETMNNDIGTEEHERAKAIVKILIENFPSSINKLLD